MRQNALAGAAAGALGGLLGSWMMVRFNDAVKGNGVGPEDRSRPHAHRRDDALPNDTDGTIPDEPGSMQAASAISEMVTGRPLDEREKETAGPILHYAFGAIAGGIYGAAAETNRSAARGFGLPFGGVVWLVADEIGMPVAGFASKPTDYSLSRHAAALGSHLVFGLTVESVRRTLRR